MRKIKQVEFFVETDLNELDQQVNAFMQDPKNFIISFDWNVEVGDFVTQYYVAVLYETEIE